MKAKGERGVVSRVRVVKIVVEESILGDHRLEVEGN